ncbi:MAG TPA: hypothetical protein VK735_39990 [Pseudonocardia sp.]|uniref:hypothetical protein n=1 Tax=Pseudonocardia sp. TaxID=60912 RepID=UPI002C072DDF|nr:hypothetical protein [Pseudonocardia sp.]HTF53666.1 hypothetical protein [Pseudonocardia sp.]
MTGWLILAIYLVGVVVTYRRAVRFTVANIDHSDQEEALIAVVLATVAALIWPVIVPIWLLWRFASPKKTKNPPKEE